MKKILLIIVAMSLLLCACKAEQEPVVSVGDGNEQDWLVVGGEHRKYGYIDRNGNWTIEPQYKTAQRFSEGLAFVTTFDGTASFIDNTGQRVIDLGAVCEINGMETTKAGISFRDDGYGSNNEDDIFIFKDGIALIKYRRDVGETKPWYRYIDRSGQTIFGPYADARGFSEGMAVVAKEFGEYLEPKKYVFIDKQGNELFGKTYDYARVFHEGLAAVSKSAGINEGVWAYIDKEGKEVIPFKYPYANSFSEGLAAVSDGNDLFGYIDKDGKLIIPHKYFQAGDFSGGIAAVSKDHDKPEDAGDIFISKEGKECFGKTFWIAIGFSEGLSAVFNKEGLYGYIDTTGNLVIPYQFVKAKDFVNGIALVSLDGSKYGYIDKTGNFVIEAKFQYWDN